jgi:hypothetical protein
LENDFDFFKKDTKGFGSPAASLGKDELTISQSTTSSCAIAIAIATSTPDFVAARR